MYDDVLARLTAALADRYRIDRELGVGGMATVFLAHDLRHDRDVAIKVLHPDLGAALGGERFLSEIRTTARLQHPHILPLLDSGAADGLLYYVMPLVTGETLRARLEREKQLPIDDAVRIAREIADALGYAHELGVIHRDIKPENILLQGNHATVADFGIALAVQQAGGHRMTQTGLSLGTPQYMSPEQAMGERVIDARSDLYALAAVTYEMLVGEPPFTGPTVQAIVARVMTEEPRSLVAQRKAIPDYVADAVGHALEKLPADRFGTAKEFAAALQGESATSTHAGGTASRNRTAQRTVVGWRARRRDPVVITLAVIALLSATLAATLAARPRRAASNGQSEVVRFTIPAPQQGRSTTLGYSTLSISADGRSLVYVGEGVAGQPQLVIRALDDVVPRLLPGTENAANPVFSPDGKWVAFFRGNTIFKIAVDGSRPEILTAAQGTFNGMSWSSSGSLIVSANTSMYAIDERGGARRVFSTPARGSGIAYQDGPVVADEAGVVLYSAWPGSSIANAKIGMVSIKTGEGTVFDLPGAQPLGLIDGVLTWVTTSGTVMGVPVDVKKGMVTGTPVQLIGDVSINTTTGIARAALSRNGTLFYQSGTQSSQVVMAGADGKTSLLLPEAREYAFPRLSPDGRRMAIAIGAPDRRDVWLYDMNLQTMTRLTSEGATNDRPEWSPDGKRVLYRTDRATRTAMWWRAADLSAEATPLAADPRLDVFEGVLSPDARFIAYQLDTAGADIYYRGISGDTTPHVVTNNKATEVMPRISPNGRWISFTTDESGRDEVVVQPFPGPGGRVQVSAGGGTEAVWSRDGKRLFYRSSTHLIAAVVEEGASFAIARRDTVLADPYVFAGNPHANYDVMPDGKHFLFLKPATAGNMMVVTNWMATVKARMAANAAK